MTSVRTGRVVEPVPSGDPALGETEAEIMFAPPVAKPKAGQPQRSTVMAHGRSQSSISQAHMLQRSIGNEAMLRLFPPRRAERIQVPPHLPAPRLPGPIQAKLEVGVAD